MDKVFLTNFLLKRELEFNTSFLHGNYKRIIDVKRAYLSSRSDLLRKKFTERGKLSRNVFFHGK